MYGKDDRSKDNRKNMKQHKNHHKQQQQHRGGNTSSSSAQTAAVRSIVDVADSSDEPRFARKGWSSGVSRTLPAQQNRDALESLPAGDDTDDVDHMDIGGGAPMNENARAQLRAGDFKQMAQFASIGGGHFTFGAEKEWNSIAEGHVQLHTKAASGYFVLNRNVLNSGLQTIPFYKRMDYPTSMFTKQQIIAQTEAAEAAERTYQDRILRELNGDKSRAASAKSIKDAPAPAATSDPLKATDELDELLAMTNTQLEQTSLLTRPKGPAADPPVVPVTPIPANATKNDVEQWLDSVLDE